jgi:hypothetical protein
MKEIQLTQGQVALVDDKDYEWLMKYKWYAAYCPTTRGYIAKTNTGHRPHRISVAMHRLIMGAKEEAVDHRDHNGLHNYRDNLRLCTVLQNNANKQTYLNNTVGIKGVYYRRTSNTGGKWRAQIQVNKRKIMLGSFTTLELAAIAYDEASYKYFGDFALTNAMIASQVT